MKKVVILTLSLILMVYTCSYSENMDWAFNFISDDTYMVSYISQQVYINHELGSYLKKVFPKIYGDYRKNLEILSYASSILMVVPRDKKESVFIIGLSSYDRDIVKSFKSILRKDEVIYPVKGHGFIKGKKSLILKMVKQRGGSYFLKLYHRMKNPIFWSSFKIKTNEKLSLLKSSMARLYPFIGLFFKKLNRIDFIVYKVKKKKHLSINFTIDGKPDGMVLKKIRKFNYDFVRFLKKRKKSSVPLFASPEKISFNYKKLNHGIIFDVSPFPDVAGEIFLSIFKSDLKLNLNDFLTLGTLSQLIMRYDMAATFYNKAYLAVKNIYNKKISDLMKREEIYNNNKNKKMVSVIESKISDLMKKKREDVASIMDLSLTAMYLSGKVKEVKSIIKMAGKKAETMYKNSIKLIKESEIKK